MKLFLTRIAYFSLIFVSSIIIVISSYFYYDPFKVIKNYDDFSYLISMANRDYISTSMFIKNYKIYNYNSFIFGSSRTSGFKPESWQEHLSENSFPFMFDASNESIYGIYKKIRYLDSLNVELKNVLIIICRDATFSNSGNEKSHLYIKHPVTSGESYLAFQYTFLKAFFNPKYLFCFYAYQIIGEYKPFMKGYIDDEKITFDTITNEMIFPGVEMELSQNPSQFYLKNKAVFYDRKGEQIDSIQRINKTQVFMMSEVKRILDNHETNYKVIISPTYDQIKFSYKDKYILKNLFGEKLYDFSGKNEFTDSITNYYEASHYRPMVGDRILNLIYK